MDRRPIGIGLRWGIDRRRATDLRWATGRRVASIADRDRRGKIAATGRTAVTGRIGAIEGTEEIAAIGCRAHR